MTRGTPILTTEAMRVAERRSGIPLAELMERAGRAVAEQVRRFALDRPVLMLCGPGNNGGDGYVAARVLDEWGLDVRLARSDEPATELARAAAARWTGGTVALDDAEARPVVVDALFGVGLSRPLASTLGERLRRLMAGADWSLAVDVPSGLRCDDGADLGSAAMSATLALGALKPAHVLMPGLERCGAVLLDDLGLVPEGAIMASSRPRLTAPAKNAQKFTRGLVAVVGGPMHGAGRLAARAALNAGAGYVRLHAPAPIFPEPDALVVAVSVDLTEALDDDRIGAIVVGPGLGRDHVAEARLMAALASERPLVIDGDALSLLGRGAAETLAGRTKPVILTPHSGEFGRLGGAGENGWDGGKIVATQALAQATGAVVVHKGPDTVVAGPDGRTRVSAAGPSWLATAGSGDVLAGAVAARLAVGGDPFEAAAEAVWLHARAAQLAGPAFHADELIPLLPRALAECL